LVFILLRLLAAVRGLARAALVHCLSNAARVSGRDIWDSLLEAVPDVAHHFPIVIGGPFCSAGFPY